MSTLNELQAQLASLAALEDKLSAVDLLPEERELLAGLLSDQRERETHCWWEARVEQAVDLLFPSWGGSRREKPQHPMWHEKSWWWNGASIESSERESNGDFVVHLRSYVGGGETDDIHGFVLKREWLAANDMPEVIQRFMAAEAARRERVSANAERARALADFERAQARLANLQAKSS